MAVLAVCLVAFSIVFVKAQPHAFYVDLWNGSDTHPLILNSESRTEDISVPINRVVLTENYAIQWNGQIITVNQLRTLLQEVGKLNPQPVVEFEPDADTSYDLSAKVLYILTTSGVEFRIAGLEKHCRFYSESSSLARSGGSLALALTLSIPEERRFQPAPSGETLFDIETCDPRYVVHRPD